MTQIEEIANDEHGRPLCIFGDPAYPLKRHLLTPYKRIGFGLTSTQKKFNYGMSRTREAVEWGFSKVLQFFAFVDFKKNLKIGLQQVGNYYKVAVLFSNCHSCLYGNQTSDYFRCSVPTLDEYLWIRNIS